MATSTQYRVEGIIGGVDILDDSQTSVVETTIVTTPKAGFYRANVYAILTHDLGAATLDVKIGYTDHKSTKLITVLPLTTLGITQGSASWTFYSPAGCAITYAITSDETSWYTCLIRIEAM